MNASKTIADHIKRCALRELQNADELGGPEFPEYVALMQEVAAECIHRADTARKTQRANERAAKRATVLAWFKRNVNESAELWDTGGGCDAIGIKYGRGADDSHWLVTGCGDGNAPEDIHKAMTLGFYRHDMEDWLTFDCRNAAHVADIIGSAINHS